MTLTLMMKMMVVLMLLVVKDLVFAENSNNSLTLDQCREIGFDPWQLSCDTCDKLLASWLKESLTEEKQQLVLMNCLSCCQIYRDLPRAQPQRYQAAILVHATGQNEHLDNLIKNDKFEETVKQLKGSRRFRRVEVPAQAAMMIPSHLYWLDQPLDERKTYDLSGLEQYESKSKETITLDASWKTDDIRDMILTLLADK